MVGTRSLRWRPAAQNCHKTYPMAENVILSRFFFFSTPDDIRLCWHVGFIDSLFLVPFIAFWGRGGTCSWKRGRGCIIPKNIDAEFIFSGKNIPYFILSFNYASLSLLVFSLWLEWGRGSYLPINRSDIRTIFLSESSSRPYRLYPPYCIGTLSFL